MRMRVVLAGERDEDVLHLVLEAQRRHHLELAADNFGVARGRDFDVQVRAAAGGAERHAALEVHEASADGAVNLS
jgi:hypothetical protein